MFHIMYCENVYVSKLYYFPYHPGNKPLLNKDPATAHLILLSFKSQYFQRDILGLRLLSIIRSAIGFDCNLPHF